MTNPSRSGKSRSHPSDPFAKARQFERADTAKASGLYPYFKAIQHHNGATVTVDNQEFILTGSNDYLGLSQDERIKQASKNATDRYGTSCTCSRFLTGTLDLHETLETQLADFLKKEKTLVFGAGFLACATSVVSNSPIIPVLVGSDDLALRFWQGLWSEGIFTTPSVSPAVPVGRSIIRTSFNAVHKPEHLERTLNAFAKIGRELGVIT